MEHRWSPSPKLIKFKVYVLNLEPFLLGLGNGDTGEYNLPEAKRTPKDQNELPTCLSGGPSTPSQYSSSPTPILEWTGPFLTGLDYSGLDPSHFICCWYDDTFPALKGSLFSENPSIMEKTGFPYNRLNIEGIYICVILWLTFLGSLCKCADGVYNVSQIWVEGIWFGS